MDEKPKALKEARDKLKRLVSGRLGDITQAKVVESFHEMMAASAGLPPPPPEQMARITELARHLMERERVQAQAAAAAGLDRRPTHQRNGRPVTTKALDASTLKSGAIDILIDRFVDLAVALHASDEMLELSRTNRLQTRLIVLTKALQARGADAQPPLLALLADRNPGVRYSAAQACLPFAPAEAERALESLTRDSAGQIGSAAQIGLDFLRRYGALKRE